MKRTAILALCLILLCACRPLETRGAPPEQSTAPPAESTPTQSEAPPESTPQIGMRLADAAYNSAFRRDFIYNPDDGCFYLCLPGEIYEGTGMWEPGQYPWDPPEIERFCKIDAETREVTVLSDEPVRNLVCDGGCVYFWGILGDGRIQRVRDGIIEEVFALHDRLPGDEAVGCSGFFVEGESLYLLFRRSDVSVRVFSLETLSEQPSLRFDVSSGAIQIFGGTIWSLSEGGLQWKEGAGELRQDIAAADLIRQFYRTAEYHQIDSFLYDGVLLAYTHQDLFLIRPDEGTLERVAREVHGYTLHDTAVWYGSGDTLYRYDIASKASTAIVSYDEDPAVNDNDYSGIENLADVKFLNGRCFLHLTGLRSYAHCRVAELNLESKAAQYLTDWFAPRINRMTSYSLGLFSYEYPNRWCVFNDYGSGGGTLFHNLEKRIRIQINSLRYIDMIGDRAIEDTARAQKTTTAQGLTLYYSYDEGEAPLAALITDGETTINITVAGDAAVIRENEDELFGILKSIRIHQP